MTVLASLILGHLLADFPLQTTPVFLWKTKSLKGVVFHAAVHLAVNALLFLPSLPTVWPALVALFLLHAAQDRLKVVIGGERINTPSPFFLDQGFHFATLGLAVLLPPLSQNPATLLPSASVAFYASGLLASTYFSAIMLFVLARRYCRGRETASLDLRRREADLLFNGLLYGFVVAGLFWLAIPVLLMKAGLYRGRVGGDRYAAPLDLGVGPVWAILMGMLIRHVVGIGALFPGIAA